MTKIFENGFSISRNWFIFQMTGADCRIVRAFVIGVVVGVYAHIVL